MSRLGVITLFVLVAFLSACGGGGGGGGGNDGGSGAVLSSTALSSSASSTSSLNASSKSSSSRSIQALAMTRKTAPTVAGVFVDTFSFAVDLPSQISDELGLYSQIPDGSSSGNCTGGGTAKITISEMGRSIQEHYESCAEGGSTLSGDRNIFISLPNAGAATQVKYIYKNFYIKLDESGASSQLWDGTITYAGSVPGHLDNDENFEVEINMDIDDSIEGFGRVKNFKITESYLSSMPFSFFDAFDHLVSVSGEINYNGTLATKLETISSGVKLSDTNGANISITRIPESMLLSWDGDNDGKADAKLEIPIINSAFPLADMTLSETQAVDRITGYGSPDGVAQDAQLYMGRGHVLDVYVENNFTSKSASLLSFELNGAASNGDEWDQPEAGHFRLKFSSNTEDKNYDLAFTAVDTNGNRSAALNAKIFVGTDTDNDGVPDQHDEDDDNDLVADNLDAFPLNPYESADSDGDGIGDNADPDADPSVNAGKVWFVDKNGIVYFEVVERFDPVAQAYKKYSKRWDSINQKFIDDLVVDYWIQTDLSYYSEEDNRLYLASNDANRTISFVDLNTLVALPFTNYGAGYIPRIKYADKNYVIITRTSSLGTEEVSLKSNGELISTSKSDAIDGFPITVYSPKLAPFCKDYVTVDASGHLYVVGTGRDRDSCAGFNPQVSLDGNYVYSGGGLFSISGTLIKGVSLTNAHWLTSGLAGLNSMSLDPLNGHQILLYDTQGNLIKDYKDFASDSYVSVFGTSAGVVAVEHLSTGKIRILALDVNLNVVSDWHN